MELILRKMDQICSQSSGKSNCNFTNYENIRDVIKLAIKHNRLDLLKHQFDLITNSKYQINFNDIIKTALLEAVDFCRINILSYLLNIRKEENEKSVLLLHRACSRGNIVLLESLIQSGELVNAIDDYGETPLHLAVKFTNIEKVVLQGYVQYPNTAMHLSVCLVELLLKYGAEMDSVDFENCTSLHHAVKCHNLLAVSVLLKHGANIDLKDENGCSPLFYATLSQNYNLVKMLIKQGAQTHLSDKYGNNILHASSGSTIITELLLDSMPESYKLIDKTNMYGNTCFHEAIENSNLSLVRLLIDRGADIEYSGNNGFTPLMRASSLSVSKRKNINEFSCSLCDVINILLEEGANMDCNDPNYKVAVQKALFSNHLCGVEMLLEQSVIKVEIISNFSPLHFAFNNGLVGMAELLLIYGADIEATYHFYKPIHYALFPKSFKEEAFEESKTISTHPSKRLLSILMEWNADINICDKEGRTILEMTFMMEMPYCFDHLKIVETLLQHRVDLLPFMKSDLYKCYLKMFGSELSYGDFKDSPSCQIFYHILFHTVKMSLLNNRKESMYYTNSELKGFYLKCEHELEALKSTRVMNDSCHLQNASVLSTYYDILTKDIHSLANFLWLNNELHQIFSSDFYTFQFPIYGPIIAASILRATKRKSFLNGSHCFFEFIHRFCGYPELPFLCIDLILKNLNCCYLNNMIRAIPSFYYCDLP